MCHHLRGLTLVGILHKVLRLMEAYLNIKHKVALKRCKVQGESARFMVFIQNRTNDGLIMSLTYILVAEVLGIKTNKAFYSTTQPIGIDGVQIHNLSGRDYCFCQKMPVHFTISSQHALCQRERDRVYIPMTHIHDLNTLNKQMRSLVSARRT